jgi:hypothetical protein
VTVVSFPLIKRPFITLHTPPNNQHHPPTMPVYTGGGQLHIEGGYNDIGRDLYHYRDNSTHNVLNPHNVSPPPADTGNRSSTSKRKRMSPFHWHSFIRLKPLQAARVFRARRSGFKLFHRCVSSVGPDIHFV